MIHKEYSWKSFDDKKLFAQSWEPDAKAKGVINIIHGMGEHCSRYHNWALKFVNEGYAVLSFDLRGHGRSEGKRGHAKEYEYLLKDVDVLIQQSNILYPDTPRILYGHSLGGNLAFNYFLTRYFRINGLIVTSPWLKLANEPPLWKFMLGKIMKKVYPSFIMDTGISSEDLTKDEDSQEEHRKDDLAHNDISVKLYFSIVEAGENVLNCVYKIRIPILCMHGKGDSITSYTASEECSLNTSESTQFKSWNIDSHELHNDEKNEEVFKYINNWLKEIGV